MIDDQVDVDVDVDVDEDVPCWRCGDPYRRHEDNGGACTARSGGRCPCLGFQWVAPQSAPGEPLGYARSKEPQQ